MNYFTVIPGDLTRALFTFFGHKSLFDLAQTSKYMAAQSHKEATRRYQPELINKPPQDKINILTARGAYYFLSRIDIAPLSLFYAAQSCDMDMILLAIKTGATDYYAGCLEAAERGHYDMAIMLFKGDHVSGCLGAACTGGNRTLIDYFISQGEPDWNSAMRGACWGGHLGLIDEFFDKYTGDPASLIISALHNLQTVQYLIEKKNIVVENDRCVCVAASNPAHMPATEYILDKFPALDTTRSFIMSCAYARANLVKRLLPSSRYEIGNGFHMACKYGNADIMIFLAEKIDVDWDAALVDVCARKGGDHRALTALTICIKNGASNLELARETFGQEVLDTLRSS
jgi:hypothetical protein